MAEAETCIHIPHSYYQAPSEGPVKQPVMPHFPYHSHSNKTRKAKWYQEINMYIQNLFNMIRHKYTSVLYFCKHPQTETLSSTLPLVPKDWPVLIFHMLRAPPSI